MTRKVHNHGPEDGPGIACPERLVGECLLQEAARYLETAAGRSDTRPARTVLRDLLGPPPAPGPSSSLSGQEDATEALPDEAGAWPLPGV